MLLKKKKKKKKYLNTEIKKAKLQGGGKRSKPKKKVQYLKVFAKLYLPKQNHIHRKYTTQRNERKRLKYTLV